jgi:ectoine hydroxylase-related dioxygenase (phytanoyl-CoA dioxygenase family)
MTVGWSSRSGAHLELRSVDCSTDDDWLPIALEALHDDGCVIVHHVLDHDLLARTRNALRVAQAAIHEEIGPDRLEAAGEVGVVRAPMRYHSQMFDLLTLAPVLAIVDATVSATAILHVQNGFITPPVRRDVSRPPTFQESFHRDFPRFLNGYMASVNTLLAIDEFRADNGATLVVPGSHQRPGQPEDAIARRDAIPATCPAGSMIVFDSTLWHAGGSNASEADRLAVNQQFTRSFIKQQLDYVRLLGEETVLALPERTQQLLGWHTRVPSSLDEYYQPPELRLYRSGQG